ncbi:MAG: hypothetical protein JWP01_4300 [Myxococcales bacterium]|nr:hypothetical protein [Myxococcales bacterium]
MTFVADFDEITFDAEHDGDLVRRMIARKTWIDAGWATVMIVFEERAKDRESWRPAKVTLLRMRRAGEGWKKHASITLPAVQATGLRVELERHAAVFAGGEGSDED